MRSFWGGWAIVGIAAVCLILLSAMPSHVTGVFVRSQVEFRPPEPQPENQSQHQSHNQSQPQSESQPQPENRSLVSIITLSRGQWWCARNTLMNACYQTYPQTSIELLIGESSLKPSPFIDANITNLRCNITLRTFWFNLTEPNAMSLGAMRNFLCKQAKGKYLLMMDNDDIYHPRYVERVVDTFSHNNSLAHLEAKPHMSAIQNPDGTIVPFPGFDPELGDHLTSLTKELAEACNYNDNYVNEEFGMMGCAKGKKFGTGVLDMHIPANSPTLIIKVQSGLSITDQVWYMNRHQYARISGNDWLLKLAHLMWYYEQMHEVQRPPHVPFMPRLGMPFPGEEAEHGKEAGIFRPPKLVQGDFWDSFHKSHVDFLSDSTLNAYCQDFALVPGTQLLEITSRKKVDSDVHCCEWCRGLTNSTSNDTCVAMSFHVPDKECMVQIQKQPFKQDFFPEHLRSPETVLDIRTAMLTSLNPSITG